jgi:hypothetical protein
LGSRVDGRFGVTGNPLIEKSTRAENHLQAESTTVAPWTEEPELIVSVVKGVVIVAEHVIVAGNWLAARAPPMLWKA